MCIGLTAFAEISRLFGVDDVSWLRAGFRMIMMAAIVSLAVWGGWGQNWNADASVSNNMILGSCVVIGLFAREPAANIESDIGLHRILDPVINLFQPKNYQFHSNTINAEIDSFVMCVAYFFGARRGLNLESLLFHHPITQKYSPEKIVRLIERQKDEAITANRILGHLARSHKRRFSRTVSNIVYFAATTGLASSNFIHRLFIITSAQGMRQEELNDALNRFGVQLEFDSYEPEYFRAEFKAEQHYTPQSAAMPSERERYLAIFGLTSDASPDEIKAAYRQMAVKYHPDRNVGKSEQEQAVAAEKMKTVNVAFDWLQANG